MLSDERIAELTYRLKGPVTNPLDWWCEADDLFTIGRELMAEVERLRHELWIASGAADDHAKRAWWNQRVMEMEASDDNATE